MAVTSLKSLGMPAGQAKRAGDLFRRHDRRVFEELAPYWDDEERFRRQIASHHGHSTAQQQ